MSNFYQKIKSIFDPFISAYISSLFDPIISYSIKSLPQKTKGFRLMKKPVIAAKTGTYGLVMYQNTLPSP